MTKIPKSTQEKLKDYLDIGQVCTELGCKYSFVFSRITKKKIKSVKVEQKLSSGHTYFKYYLSTETVDLLREELAEKQKQRIVQKLIMPPPCDSKEVQRLYLGHEILVSTCSTPGVVKVQTRASEVDVFLAQVKVFCLVTKRYFRNLKNAILGKDVYREEEYD